MNPRYVPFIMMLCLLMPSCGEKHNNGDGNDSIAVNDTDTLVIDTIENDKYAMAAPPKKADELFDDFVYAFMRSKKFQHARIQFPLRNVVDGENEPISERQWRHDPLYSDRALYMTVSSSRKGAAMAKDTSINSVAVLDIHPEEKVVKQYEFNRIDNVWKLTQIQHGHIDDLAAGSADFMNFYCKFLSDKDYQQEHIAEYVNVNIRDDEEGENIEGTIDAAQWPDFAPILPDDKIMCVRYGKTYSKSNRRIVNIATPSGDEGITMTFNKKGDTWLLTDYEN